MVNPNDGNIKLIDFGISCLKKTCDKASWGTHIYMPPQMLNNYNENFQFIKNNISYDDNIKYDNWALGLVLLTLANKNLNNKILDDNGYDDYSLRDFYNSKKSKTILQKAQAKIDKLFNYKIFV
jgi:serine/threonine protein kinase